MKCGSPRADRRRRAGAVAASFVLAASASALQAQGRPGAGLPSWVACAGPPGAGTLEPLRRLTALTDHALVEAVVKRIFAEREKEQRVSPANLASARLTIDFLYAAGQGPSRVFYYEASKMIPDAEGLLRVSVAGWLRGEGPAQRSLGSKSELQWAEFADADDEERVIPEPRTIPAATPGLVPAGALARAGQQTWVMRRARGAGTVLVYDVGPSGVRLRTAAAGKGC